MLLKHRPRLANKINRWSEKRNINKNIYGCDKCIIIFHFSSSPIIQVLRIKNANICEERERDIWQRDKSNWREKKISRTLFGVRDELMHEMMTKGEVMLMLFTIKALIKNGFLSPLQFKSPYLDLDHQSSEHEHFWVVALFAAEFQHECVSKRPSERFTWSFTEGFTLIKISKAISATRSLIESDVERKVTKEDSKEFLRRQLKIERTQLCKRESCWIFLCAAWQL